MLHSLKQQLIIKPYKFLHEKLLFNGRCTVLIDHLNTFFPKNESATVLDIGCGDGRISYALAQLNPQLQFSGLEVMAREQCASSYQLFCGKKIPLADKSIDYVLFVDVLHHTINIEELLQEAKRVAKKGIIIKDHYANNIIDWYLLAIADWIGNWAYKVHLPYNYKSKNEWQKLFDKLGLQIVQTNKKIHLYSLPFSIIFRPRIHFIAKLIEQHHDTVQSN
jgi:ubiquinone/menaquinone biosynthesis C-methylase UbiE